MKNFSHLWRRKSCLLLFALAASSTGFSMSPSETKTTIVQPIAWTITGKVVTASGEAIPGVTVLQKGTSNGTATGIDGSYSISVPEAAGSLVFSFIGFTTQEKAYTGPGSINVTLTDDAKALEEVVVVGYGTQKKSDLTGSVAAVSAKDFNQGNVNTPEQLIVGKVPGVQITTNGGAPGSGSQIRIRGGASLNANNDPLIVIDGVPVDNEKISGSPNPLSLVNPNDIESFNILKDASATAIYGSRASNGVIIITTKKGKAGDKFTVGFSSLASVSQVTNTIDVLSADQFRAVVNERGTTAQQALLGAANTNWQDQIFRRAFSTDNNLSFTGSYKSVPYRLSVGRLDQNGIIKTSNLERNSVALSLNPTFLEEHLSVNLNVKGTLSKSRFASEGVIGSAVAFDPTQPVNVSETKYGGYFEWLDASGRPNTLAPRNPLSTLEQRRDIGEVKRSIGNIQLDYRFHFLPELRANLNLGYDIVRGEGSTTEPITLAGVFNQGGNRTQYSQEKDNKLLDFYLNYSKELTAIKSRVEVMGGYSYQNFLRHEPSYAGLNAAGDTLTPAAAFPFETEKTLLAFFGRINYSFKDRYLLTANLRRDASSAFGPNNKWGTFPSLALAWRLIEEPFLRGNNTLTDLKLRLGYGITGQQELLDDNYPYLARYRYSEGTATYPFGDQYYLTLRPAGYDENIKWEETKAYNAGLDFGLFNGKVSGTVDYYFKKTEDLISQISPAAGTNLTNQIFTNVGNLENEGVEVALTFNPITNENFSWSFGVNGTYNESKITKLSNVSNPSSPGLARGAISGGTGNMLQIHSVGYAPYTFYTYKQVYDEAGKPVEGAYVDLNKDGIINEQDLYHYKSPQPKVFLGFNSNITYKNWNAGVVLRANLGNYMYNNVQSNNGTYRSISNSTYLSNMASDVLSTNFTNNQYFSDYYIENASFLRLDNITIGYNFGKIINEKVNLRLSATGQNVFLITKYSGLDPESQFNNNNIGGGIDNNYYPRPRTFSLGVNLDF
ncbi:SusC/RagA family protein [Adhaeribacter arboris]|uniref:SusC/RagA family protein n=1 Tax=Adhaeribacter arboris TaxID=2072846 RepID=A0A2T2YFP9_9BACT|nr:TonB-dependent receptor [Adhaeribacter arboris]PSR54324.1 SusC/RagA family protein [Adhaeribacter arboris]